MLPWTLITIIEILISKFFEIDHFKGCLSQSQVRRCSMRFLGSRKCPWTQNSYEGMIFYNEHDDLKLFWIPYVFKIFGKSRSKIWVPHMLPVNWFCRSKKTGLLKLKKKHFWKIYFLSLIILAENATTSVFLVTEIFLIFQYDLWIGF